MDFLTKEEWFQELEVLFHDLQGENGKIVQRVTLFHHSLLELQPDPKSQAGVALAKLKIVYGADLKVESLQQLKRINNRITRALGTQQKIERDDPDQFRRAIERYADSNNVATDLAYWPIVKKITIQGPWDALRSGAVLVDAPGVRDDNSARDAVVKGMNHNVVSVTLQDTLGMATVYGLLRTLSGL